jgi:hypothetical protein
MKMKIDHLVAKILVAENFDHFTTSDVRSAFLALKNDSKLDPASVRRKVYAELLKLTKKGWLKKLASNKNGLTRFSKTTFFDVKKLFLIIEGVNASNVTNAKETHLLVKLNYYKAELLLNMGESEAYKELYSEYPDLVDEIQPQFNEARDNNTRILGKIKAIEGLLKKNIPVETI